jgi:prevent-host-death family protein
MARKKGPVKVTGAEFVASVSSLLEGIKDMDAPLMITAKGRPAAYLMNAAEYELCQKKLTAYERMTKALDEADRLRMEAQAKAIAEVTRRGRKV